MNKISAPSVCIPTQLRKPFISKKNMMYNALGQLVKAFGDAQQIPLNDLPDGLYHLVATDEKGTIRNTKVIIGH